VQVKIMGYQIRQLHHLCIMLVLTVILAGCTINVRPEVDPSSFKGSSGSSSNLIPKRVALVLTKEFVTHTYDFRVGLDPYSYHIGPSLEAYAKRIAESHFQSTQVVSGEAGATDVDFILTPSVRRSELTSAVTVLDKQHMTIDVEWTITTAPGSPPVWVSTFSGNSEGKQGTPFSGFKGGKTMIQNMVADLFKQTDRGFLKLHQMDAFR
jgi:hypothetical protein